MEALGWCNRSASSVSSDRGQHSVSDSICLNSLLPNYHRHDQLILIQRSISSMSENYYHEPLSFHHRDVSRNKILVAYIWRSSDEFCIRSFFTSLDFYITEIDLFR